MPSSQLEFNTLQNSKVIKQHPSKISKQPKIPTLQSLKWPNKKKRGLNTWVARTNLHFVTSQQQPIKATRKIIEWPPTILTRHRKSHSDNLHKSHETQSYGIPMCSLDSQRVPKGCSQQHLAFNPICFAQSPPLLTNIAGPKGEALLCSIEFSILGSLHVPNGFLSDYQYVPYVPNVFPKGILNITSLLKS